MKQAPADYMMHELRWCAFRGSGNGNAFNVIPRHSRSTACCKPDMPGRRNTSKFLIIVPSTPSTYSGFPGVLVKWWMECGWEDQICCMWQNRSSGKWRVLAEPIGWGERGAGLAVLFMCSWSQKGKGPSEKMRTSLMDTAAAPLICSNTIVTSQSTCIRVRWNVGQGKGAMTLNVKAKRQKRPEQINHDQI